MGIGLDPNFWHNNQNPSQLRSVVLTRVPLPSASRYYPVFHLHRSTCCPPMISPLSRNPSVLWDHVKFFSIVRNPSWLPLPSCLKEVVLSLLYCHNMTLSSDISYSIIISYLQEGIAFSLSFLRVWYVCISIYINCIVHSITFSQELDNLDSTPITSAE